jgi:hypothetical protein
MMPPGPPGPPPQMNAPFYPDSNNLRYLTSGVHLQNDVLYPNGMKNYDSVHRVFYHENGQIAYEFRENHAFYITGFIAYVKFQISSSSFLAFFD